MATANIGDAITGIIHGKTVELQHETGLPDGQEVTVVIQPVKEKVKAGEALMRAFRGWADDPEGLDEFLRAIRRLRDVPSGAGT